MKFVHKFYRYDYLGNIYSMKISDYIKYIQESYQQFIEASNSTFINIMKQFISKDTDIQKMFKYIFLLLLGSSDNIDVASLLLGLTKEKKTNNQYIYNYMSQRLPYYLLVKIKKSHNNIKIDLDKIKSLSIDDIDYKSTFTTDNKQIWTTKNNESQTSIGGLTKNDLLNKKLYWKTLW